MTLGQILTHRGDGVQLAVWQINRLASKTPQQRQEVESMCRELLDCRAVWLQVSGKDVQVRLGASEVDFSGWSGGTCRSGIELILHRTGALHDASFAFSQPQRLPNGNCLSLLDAHDHTRDYFTISAGLRHWLLNPPSRSVATTRCSGPFHWRYCCRAWACRGGRWVSLVRALYSLYCFFG
jgi:hypothetical protein